LKSNFGGQNAGFGGEGGSDMGSGKEGEPSKGKLTMHSTGGGTGGRWNNGGESLKTVGKKAIAGKGAAGAGSRKGSCKWERTGLKTQKPAPNGKQKISSKMQGVKITALKRKGAKVLIGA